MNANNDSLVKRTVDPRLVTDVVEALSSNLNVMIFASDPGIGLVSQLSDALGETAHTIFATDALSGLDIDGLPFPSNGEIVRSTPMFTSAFGEDRVIVLDEVQAANPRVAEYIRSQGNRGRIVLIFRNHFGLHEYAKFPAVRFAS